MKNNNELLQFCRYYKGEDKCPFDDDPNKAMLWDYEQIWVIEHKRNKSELSNYQEECMHDYISHGLADFQNKDGIPISLKALLFNRYELPDNDTSPFKRFYKKYYTSKTQD